MMGSERPSVLLLMEDYRGSITQASEHAQQIGKPYGEVAQAVFAQSIYYGDSYLDAFRQIGVSAQQVVPLCRPLQYQWAREHGITVPPAIVAGRPVRWWWTRRGLPHPRDRVLGRIVAEQVRRMKPDVLWVFSGVPVTRADLDEWRPHVGQTVLWWSCAIDERVPYDRFSLILSASRELVETFRAWGLRAEQMAHAFDPRILERIPASGDRLPRIAFAGSLAPTHGERTTLLDALSRRVPVDFYGPGIEELPQDSPLRTRARPAVWGDDLYRIYARYQLVVNANPNFAVASSKRLFEATGMGACLVTQRHPDLGTLFDPDGEVAVYESTEDAVEIADGLLRSRSRARSIGEAGQRRTIHAHTYAARVRRFMEVTNP